ncbi:hypothetical protein U6A24_03465 [Aquimarina gracilis]|uniref:STAS/SEC14 domain-containing protein n=1 Tax=Aquimarina gracilis TaxID=874422 RepID=A0ABU5ZR34_9FLAO|nr:hypothetical protein [Aquimarina gracilis]MEB3344502.1 hypothetical protein [Aquimarina gracilis]
MSHKKNRILIEKHILDIGTFYFYENFIVGEIVEGVNLNFESGKELFKLAQANYKNDKPFVYISNRINSYSFIPTGHYKSVALFPNLKGYATVVYNDINYRIAELEQSFMNWPNGIFENLEDAIDWAEDILSSH